MLRFTKILKIGTFLLFGLAISEPAAGFQFRSIDGSGNNINKPNWGQANTQLLRLTFPAYEDGTSAPRGGDPSTLPSPRKISNAVSAQSESIKNSNNLSDWFWQWGQFLDHDIDLTEAQKPPESFNIPVPDDDLFFMAEIELNRSIYEVDTDGVRQQINEITAYIDASMLYGSDQARADVLRSGSDGKFKASEGKLMMFNTVGEENANGGMFDDDELFLSGDVRANEQIGLISVHTLFMREHNRLVEEIKSELEAGKDELVQKFEAFEEEFLMENPGLMDEDEDVLDKKVLDEFLYQIGRKIVGAQIQMITYNEFLPLLLGDNALAPFNGYDDTVNASISNEFSTAAFRFGHTMLSPELKCTGEENVSLQNSFFRPDIIVENGIDCFLSGLASQKAQEIDPFVIDDVRNFLFGPPGAGGFDLASLNIQRGRDHGIPSYNEVRSALGLGAVADFTDITSNVEIQEKLASVYDNVNDVDLWIGGLAEDRVNGGVVGEVFSEIIKDQFIRLRDGDRFFYLNELDHLLAIAPDLTETKLSDIILRNSSVTKIQDNVFLVTVPESSSSWGLVILGVLGFLYFGRYKTE